MALRDKTIELGVDLDRAQDLALALLGLHVVPLKSGIPRPVEDIDGSLQNALLIGIWG
jgi:hypothetical protein